MKKLFIFTIAALAIVTTNETRSAIYTLKNESGEDVSVTERYGSSNWMQRSFHIKAGESLIRNCNADKGFRAPLCLVKFNSYSTSGVCRLCDKTVTITKQQNGELKLDVSK